MAAQNRKKKKNCRQKFFAFLNVFSPQTPKPNYSRFTTLLILPRGRLLENKKAGGPKELFLLENDFKTSFTVNFPKNIQIRRSGNQLET